MTRSDIAMVDTPRGSATEKSSQLQNEKTSHLPSSPQSFRSQTLLFAIFRRALALSLTRKNPPSDTRPPTKTTSGCASLNSVAADREGYNTVLADTNAKSGTGDGGNGEIPSDRCHAPQLSGAGTPTMNPTPPCFLKVTVSDSETGSSTSLCAGSISVCDRLSLGEGQHENGISTASHKSFARLPDDPFRGAVRIPGCKPTTFVYPHSSTVIDALFDERYREVVNIFRHNTKEHPRLRENLQYIDYTLKLCGTSSTDSHPSILVFCRHSEFEDLKVLLTSKELKYQYCLRRPARKYPWSGSQTSAFELDHRPFFNLYFWRQRRPRTLYWGQESVRIYSQLNMPPEGSETHPHMMPGLTMCGSVVELLGSESSFSTLGCVIKIDSEFYAITSMHAVSLFQHRKKLHSEEMYDCRSVDRSGTGTAAGEVEELFSYYEEPLGCSDTDPFDASLEDNDYLIDDIEYESLGEDYDGALDLVDSRSTVTNASCDNETQTSGQIREVKEMLALFPTPDELDRYGELDLDWALIKLVDQQDWRPNAFIYPSVSSSPLFLSKVADSQPTQETPVFIITGEPTPQRGLLQPGTSMLGGINGRTPSMMWTVVLADQDSLKRGDSGSVVVDATTNTIYGHVIGLNPIGEVYISPYVAILEQIQHRFPGSAVVIPEPISTLACLVDFYTMSLRDESSRKSLRYLEDAYRKAAARLDEEQISPVFLQHHPPDAAAGVSGGQKSPSMLHFTATARSFNTNGDPVLVAGANIPQPCNHDIKSPPTTSSSNPSSSADRSNKMSHSCPFLDDYANYSLKTNPSFDCDSTHRPSVRQPTTPNEGCSVFCSLSEVLKSPSRGVTSRTQSISSDRPSAIAHSLMSAPLTATPEGAFLGTSDPSQIVKNDHETQAETGYYQHDIESTGQTDLVSSSARSMLSVYDHALAGTLTADSLMGHQEINSVNPETKLTPLGAAVWHGHIDQINLLLERGADPNGTDGARPPLWVATSKPIKNAGRIVEILLNHGADPSLLSEINENSTPLMGTEKLYKPPAVISELVDAGASPTTASNEREMAEQVATKKKYCAWMQAMLPRSQSASKRLLILSLVSGLMLFIVAWANRNAKVAMAAAGITGAGLVAVDAIKKRFGKGGMFDSMIPTNLRVPMSVKQFKEGLHDHIETNLNFQPSTMTGMPMLLDSAAPRADTENEETEVSHRSWDVSSKIWPSAPPAYEDIYPQEQLHWKQPSATQAAIEAKTDAKSATSYDQASVFGTIGIKISRGNALTKEQQRQFRRAHEVAMKRISRDHNIFFIWIPLLLVMVCAMLYSYFPNPILTARQNS